MTIFVAEIQSHFNSTENASIIEVVFFVREPSEQSQKRSTHGSLTLDQYQYWTPNFPAKFQHQLDNSIDIFRFPPLNHPLFIDFPIESHRYL